MATGGPKRVGRRTFVGLGLTGGVATVLGATEPFRLAFPAPPANAGDRADGVGAGEPPSYVDSPVHRRHPLEFRIDSSFRPDLSDRAAEDTVSAVLAFLDAEHPDGLTMTFWDLHPSRMPYLPEHVSRIVDRLFAAVAGVADVRPVDPLAVLALLYNESRFHPKVVSPAGAVGMAQIMPETALELGLAPTAREDLWAAFRAARRAYRAARAEAVERFRERHGGIGNSAVDAIDRALTTGDTAVLADWKELDGMPDPSRDALEAYVRALEEAFSRHEFFWDGREPLSTLDARVGYAAVDGAVRYLARELDAHQGLASTAVAAYNAGPGSVRRAGPQSILHRFGDLPEYPETVRYVQRFLAVYSALKYRLYRRDPGAVPGRG